MTTPLTHVTTGSGLVRSLADVARETEAAAEARAWIARQLRFERFLRDLEEEPAGEPANPSVDAA